MPITSATRLSASAGWPARKMNPIVKTMLNDARPYFSAVPLLVIVPGVTIAVLVLCGNLLGDAIRDLADIGHRPR